MIGFWRDESGAATREWMSSTAMFLTAVTVILVVIGSDDANLGARLTDGKARMASTWEAAQPYVETAKGWVGL